jgi:hypothetical protein
MSFEAIQQEISNLGTPELRKLIGCAMSALQRREDPDFPARMAELIDDKTPGRWLTAEEAEKRLGISPSAE